MKKSAEEKRLDRVSNANRPEGYHIPATPKAVSHNYGPVIGCSKCEFASNDSASLKRHEKEFHTSHTPTPWKVAKSQHDEGLILIESAFIDNVGTKIIGEMDRLDERYANAAYIVMAVNMHETLVQALRLLTEEISLNKLNIRKDFSLINAHANALKALASSSEVK